MFNPVDDICINDDCKKKINPVLDRHYIVWDEKKQVYKRECASCWDKVRRPGLFERKTASDFVMHSTPFRG